MELNTLWNHHQINVGQTMYIQIGPLHLWIARREKEFGIRVKRQLDDPYFVEKEYTNFDVTYDPEAGSNRYITFEDTSGVFFSPVLPDKPVVVWPERPFYVLGGEEVNFFVGISLWADVFSYPHKKHMTCFPIINLSNTWFGENTIKGEVCYSASTKGRTHLEKIPLLPYRFFNKVKIINKTKKPVNLERVKIVVDYLNLYETKNGRYVSDNTYVEVVGGEKQYKVRLQKPREKDFGPIKLIKKAKKKFERSIFIDTINKVIH